jgi:heat shock protein HslJ
MNAKHTAAASLAFVVLLGLTACAGIVPGTGDPLDGTSWVLTAYGTSSLIPGTEITLEWERGEVSGSAGCNTYGGTYKVSGDSVSMTDLYNTEMACMEPEGVMDQEQDFLKLLRDARSFKIVDEHLQIFTEEKEALTFAPAG